MTGRAFIKSGIPGLDSVLGGGFLQNSITTIGGPTGVGKSTFAAQFLYNGAYDSSEVGLYICIEESRQDFLFHMSGYEWDITQAEKDHKMVFLDYPLYEVDQLVEQSSAVAEIINSIGAKRVVIDSIMPIALYYKSDDERKKGFLRLIDSIRKWNATTLIVSEDIAPAPQGSLPYSGYGIERYTDGWIDISYRCDEITGERKRYVEVLKMKGVAHSTKQFPATIGSKGFTIINEEPPPAAQAVEKKPALKAAPAPPKAPARPLTKSLFLTSRIEAAKKRLLKKK